MTYKVLTAQEVAELLDVNKETIYRLVRINAIPYFRVGSALRFTEEAIQKWISKNETKED